MNGKRLGLVRTSAVAVNGAGEETPVELDEPVCHCGCLYFKVFQVVGDDHFHLRCRSCGVSYCPGGECEVRKLSQLDKCLACGRPIVWQMTARGKKMPLDPPVKQVMAADGTVHRGRESHYATCPKAASFRGVSRGQVGIDPIKDDASAPPA